MKLSCLCLLITIVLVSGSPVDEDEKNDRYELLERLKKLQGSLQMQEGEGGVEYERYWKELMANNPELAKRFEQMPPETVAHRMGDRVAHRNGNIRSQLDEMQRINIEKMRELNSREKMEQMYEHDPKETRNRPVHRSADIRREGNGWPDPRENVNSEDIKNRIQEHRKIQEELDALRKDEYKHFESRIEALRKKKLKEMDETQRLKEEERLDQLVKERMAHERMEHPASRKQLEDVWEKQDGLADADFDPKTFFFLHDNNGDRVLDAYEVEALFMNEIKKVYGNEVDSMTVREELAEMREHVIGEIDKDRDGLISLDEFLGYANKDIFNVDEEWKPLEERDGKIILSPKELERLEADLGDNYDILYDYDDDGNIAIVKKQEKEDMKEQNRQDVPEGNDHKDNEHASPSDGPEDIIKVQDDVSKVDVGIVNEEQQTESETEKKEIQPSDMIPSDMTQEEGKL